MITAAFIVIGSSLAVILVTIGAAVWAWHKAGDLADRLIAQVKETGDLQIKNQELQLALSERDQTIDELTTQATRLRDALDVAEKPPLIKDNPGATIRQSMDALRAAAKASPPAKPAPAPATTTPSPARDPGSSHGPVLGPPAPPRAGVLPTPSTGSSPAAKSGPDRSTMHEPDPGATKPK